MPLVKETPKGWPDDVLYVASPVYSKSVSPTQLQRCKSDVANNQPVIKPQDISVPVAHVRVQLIESPSNHPALGQRGLFASRPLPPDTFICFYLGMVHDASETDPTSDYDLSLNRDLEIGVDATHYGNEARFINDYRGIRPDGPNAEFRDCLVEVGNGKVEVRIGVYVVRAGKDKKGGAGGKKRARGIRKGDEVVVSYGKGFWAHRTLESRAGEAE